MPRSVLLMLAKRKQEARDPGRGPRSHSLVTEVSSAQGARHSPPTSRAVLALPFAAPAAGTTGGGLGPGPPTTGLWRRDLPSDRRRDLPLTGRPMTCNRWVRGAPSQSQGAGTSQELGSRNPATKYAELLPEPPEWHLDRALLSAFGSWRRLLLGLLLGMCAPGGCGSRALAGGLRILGFRG